MSFYFAAIGMAGLALFFSALSGSAAPFAQTTDDTLSPPSATAPSPDRLRDATARYEELVREHPRSAELWSNLGTVRAMAGDCGSALEALRRARSLNASLSTPWLFSGYCHLALHRDQDALQELDEATRLNPRDANGWFLRAQAAGNLSKLSDSFEAAVHSLELDQSRAAAFYLAGKNGLDLAASAYNRVFADRPDPNLYSLLLEGQRNAAQGVWELAIDRYEKAQKIDPRDPEIMFSLGTVYLEEGRYLEAEDAFRRCLRLLPQSVWARLRLTLSLVEDSKRAEAQDLFDKVRLSDLNLPSEYEDYIASAYLLGLDGIARTALTQGEVRFRYYLQWPLWSERLRPGETEQASSGHRSFKPQDLTGIGLSIRFSIIADSDRKNFVRQAFPTAIAYQRFRGAFLEGDWVQAAEQTLPILRRPKPGPAAAFVLGEILHSLAYGFYERLAVEFPDSGTTMKLAAENYATMGNQAKALEIYEAELHKEGPSPDLLRDIAQIYWTRHEWEHALQILRSLAAIDPNDPTIFVNMGRIYSFEQNEKDAEESFRRAAQLDSSMFEAHLGLGQTLRRKGDDKGALKELELAARLDPTNPRMHYEISQIYRKLGDTNRAAAEMGTFQRLQAAERPEAAQKNRQLVPLD